VRIYLAKAEIAGEKKQELNGSLWDEKWPKDNDVRTLDEEADGRWS
jgi:hypothetical protein